MDKKFANYIAMAIAFVVAIIIVALVKYFLIPTAKAASFAEFILWLEAAIMALIMSAFALNEVMKVGDKIAGKAAEPPQHSSRADLISPLTLMVAFGASVLIILAAMTWIHHFLPQVMQSTTSK